MKKAVLTASEAVALVRDGDTVAIYESGVWTRLTTKRGHVLVKRRGWKLVR